MARVRIVEGGSLSLWAKTDAMIEAVADDDSGWKICTIADIDVGGEEIEVVTHRVGYWVKSGGVNKYIDPTPDSTLGGSS